jgi:hypothetical protein
MARAPERDRERERESERENERESARARWVTALSLQAVEQRSDSVHPAGKLCPFYLLSHKAVHSKRAVESGVSGSAGGCEYVVRVYKQPNTKTVLKKIHKTERTASALGVHPSRGRFSGSKFFCAPGPGGGGGILKIRFSHELHSRVLTTCIRKAQARRPSRHPLVLLRCQNDSCWQWQLVHEEPSHCFSGWQQASGALRRIRQRLQTMLKPLRPWSWS